MFFIYSKDLFLLNKQLNKLIKNIKIENQETEVKKYSWIEDDFETILKDIISPSFFIDQKIIVIKDAYFLTEKKKEANWINNNSLLIDQLLEKKNLESIIIFTLNEEKISKKLKLTHKFEKKVKMIKVEELTETQIRHFIQKKIELKDKKISEQVITFFLKKVPNNMLVINNELMKLLNLSIIEIDEKIIEANVSNYFEKDAYKLSEYFQKNQIEKFLQAFHNYLSLSSDLIPLLYLFNTNLTFIRDCLLLKANGKNIEKTAELLNAHPYRIKLALEQNNLTIKQLNDKILVLYDLNKMIIKGVTNPILNSELELIKNMTRS